MLEQFLTQYYSRVTQMPTLLKQASHSFPVSVCRSCTSRARWR